MVSATEAATSTTSTVERPARWSPLPAIVWRQPASARSPGAGTNRLWCHLRRSWQPSTRDRRRRPWWLPKDFETVWGCHERKIPGLQRNISAVIFGFRTATARLAITAQDNAMPESELRSRTLELNRQLHQMDRRPPFLPGEI